MLLSARVLTVEDFFLLGTFAPASVQRDYVWSGQHAEDLFNDIDRACVQLVDDPEEGGEPHIAVMEGNGDKDESEILPGAPAWLADGEAAPGYHLGEVTLRRLDAGQFEIFDGLQRATTLTILLSVLRDLTPSEGLRNRIRAVLNNGTAYRFLLPGADSTLIDEVQTEGSTAKSFRRAVSDRGRKIRAVRTVFFNHLKNWSEARFAQFAHFLLDRTYFVATETDSQLLARQVFITSNNRGITLRPIDIFKGQIFGIAGSEQIASSLTKFWDALLLIVGDNLDEFMRAFDFIKRQNPQGADHLAKLADYIEKTHGPERLHEVIAEIHLYASSWQVLNANLKQSQPPISEPGIWRLGFFKWFEWKPLALAWLKQYRDSQARNDGSARTKATKTFDHRFERLHRACMIITLAKFSAVDREKIFGNALKQWRAGRDPFSASGQRPGALTFTARQLARALETLITPLHDDETRLSLLRWLETMTAGPDLAVGAATASVEHVLPHRPAPDSQWLKDFPDEEERFSACNSVGNLALMDHSENLKISNADFHLKLPVIKAQSKKYRTLAGVADKTIWRAAEIRERAAKMIGFACTQLNIPRSAQS